MAEVLTVKPPLPEMASHLPFPSSPRLISQPLLLASPHFPHKMADIASPNSTIIDVLRTAIPTEPQRPGSAPPGFTTRHHSSSDYTDTEFVIERKENGDNLNKFNDIIKSETSSYSPKWFAPLTTGRAWLIRTESVEKN